MDIELNNGILYIDATGTSSPNKKIYKIYADHVCNKNYMSTFDEEHDNVISEEYTLDEIISIDLTNNPNKAYIVTILVHDDLTLEDETTIKFVIDKEYIYRSIVDMLVSTCNNCVNDTHKQKTVMCYFRLDLLRYAMLNDKLNDCIYLYKDLMRILSKNDKIDLLYDNKRDSCANTSTCDDTYRMINNENTFNNLHRWIDVI